MKRRNFLAVSAFAAAGDFSPPAITEPASSASSPNPFSWNAYAVTFLFDLHKGQLRQQFVLPSNAPASVQTRPTPTAERTTSRAEFEGQKRTTIPGGKRLILTHHDPISNLAVESYYDAFEGVPVIRRYTRVTNMSQHVRDYLAKVIDRVLCDYGVPYIKWDYNVDGLEVTELHADSFAQGLYEHNLALLTWLDEMLVRYPSLIVENCASGGGRVNYAMLSRFQLKSASDQDDYHRCSALVTGLSAGLPPEQIGVWSFLSASASSDKASSNMVNAMLARIHLSGDIAKLNLAALAQIRTGIELYKKVVHKKVVRQHVSESLPFYSLALPDITDQWSPVALA